VVCQRDKRLLQKGAGHLLYKLIDELVSDYMPVVEQIDETIDQIEDQIFGEPSPLILEQIFTLKRALLRLRRIIGPQREVVNKLARGDYATVATEERVFFRDVYDHLVRLYDITENLRDLTASALDTYLSVVNNRMNEVMKTLTVITTLFMPLSFLVGFFGMNFFQPVVPLSAWTGKVAFGLTLAAMVLAPVGMYLWMKARV
jgi:magnesium transporter